MTPQGSDAATLSILDKIRVRMNPQLKANLKQAYARLWSVADAVPGLGAWYRRRTFQRIYRDKKWGGENSAAFFSGHGSRNEAAELYVERMSALIAGHAAELGRPVTVVDMGCGDFRIGAALLTRMPDANYVGCDIVPELIAHHALNAVDARASFRVVDILTDDLPDGDVCLIRQVLQHLSNAEIVRVLAKLDTYAAVYITEGQPVTVEGPPNPDKAVGRGVRFDMQSGRGRGVELDLPPFGMQVVEMFRAVPIPTEVVVTWRVSRA